VAEEKVFAVLYNSGTQVESIPFTEKRIEAEVMMKIGQMLGSVSMVPTGMVSSKDEVDIEEV